MVSQTGHRKGRRSSALLNWVVYIKDRLPLGFFFFSFFFFFFFFGGGGLLDLFGFILSPAKIVKSSFATRETTETLNLYG